MKIIGF